MNVLDSFTIDAIRCENCDKQVSVTELESVEVQSPVFGPCDMRVCEDCRKPIDAHISETEHNVLAVIYTGQGAIVGIGKTQEEAIAYLRENFAEQKWRDIPNLVINR